MQSLERAQIRFTESGHSQEGGWRGGRKVERGSTFALYRRQVGVAVCWVLGGKGGSPLSPNHPSEAAHLYHNICLRPLVWPPDTDKDNFYDKLCPVVAKTILPQTPSYSQKTGMLMLANPNPVLDMRGCVANIAWAQKIQRTRDYWSLPCPATWSSATHVPKMTQSSDHLHLRGKTDSD